MPQDTALVLVVQLDTFKMYRSCKLLEKRLQSWTKFLHSYKVAQMLPVSFVATFSICSIPLLQL